MNEVEDKEIDELKKFACIVCEMGNYEEYESGKIKYGCIERSGECNCGIGDGLAKALYNAGYRKEKDIEYYKTIITNLNKEIERLKKENERLKNDKCVTIGIDEKYIKDTIREDMKKTCLQMIKDFTEALKGCINVIDYLKPVKNRLNALIDNLLKEYGV